MVNTVLTEDNSRINCTHRPSYQSMAEGSKAAGVDPNRELSPRSLILEPLPSGSEVPARSVPVPAPSNPRPRGGETPLTAGTVLAIGTHNQHQLIQAVGAMPQPTGVAGRPSQCSPCRSRETQAYESYLMPGKATQNLRHRQIWREPSTGMCLTWNYFRQTATKAYQERANTGSEYGIGARPLNGRKRNKTPRPTPCKATFCNVT